MFHSFGLCFVFAFKFVVFFVLVGWLIAGCLLLLTSATVFMSLLPERRFVAMLHYLMFPCDFKLFSNIAESLLVRC